MAEDQDNRPIGDPPQVDGSMFSLSAGDPPTGGSGGGLTPPGSGGNALTGDTTEETEPISTNNLVGDPPTGGSGGGGITPPADEETDTPPDGTGT